MLVLGLTCLSPTVVWYDVILSKHHLVLQLTQLTLLFKKCMGIDCFSLNAKHISMAKPATLIFDYRRLKTIVSTQPIIFSTES